MCTITVHGRHYDQPIALEQEHYPVDRAVLVSRNEDGAYIVEFRDVVDGCDGASHDTWNGVLWEYVCVAPNGSREELWFGAAPSDEGALATVDQYIPRDYLAALIDDVAKQWRRACAPCVQ